MEYQIYKALRHNVRIPFIIRVVLGIFFIGLSIIPIILPIFPWSLVPWVFLFVMWILLLVSWRDVRHVIKIRKGIVYLAKNLHRKKTIRRKIFDIKKHIKKILDK